DRQSEQEFFPLARDEAANPGIRFDYCNRLASPIEDRSVAADPTAILILINVAARWQLRFPSLEKGRAIGERQGVMTADERLLLEHDDEFRLERGSHADRAQNIHFIFRQPIDLPGL